jgi:hypothetical protein
MPDHAFAIVSPMNLKACSCPQKSFCVHPIEALEIDSAARSAGAAAKAPRSFVHTIHQ